MLKSLKVSGKSFLVFLLPLLVIPVVYMFYQEDPFILVHPANDRVGQPYALNIFDDRYQNGKSQVSIIENQGHKMSYRYTLSDAFLNPYAGVEYHPGENSFFDLSGYDYLKVKIRADKGKHILLNVCIQIEVDDPNQFMFGYMEGGVRKAFRIMSTVLNTDTNFHELKIPMDMLASPDWYYKDGNIEKNQLGTPDYSKAIFIYFGNCVSIKPGMEDLVELEEFTFHKEYNTFYLASGLGWLVYVVIAFMFFNKRKKQWDINFQHGKLTSGLPFNQEEELVFGYITSHYHMQELSMAEIQSATGFSEKKIAEIIKGKTDLNFKQFLNKLRISEAKRLLLETDLNISEIAQKVGYGNVTHFNRVFKMNEDCSPNEYKKGATQQLPSEMN